MTDKSPTLWASANLTPVSPAPVHPSSPVIVPTLQDQADSLSTMSQSDSYRADGHSSGAFASITGQVMFSNQEQGAVFNGHGHIANRDVEPSHPSIGTDPSNGEILAHDGGISAIGSEGDWQNSNSAVVEPIEIQQDVSKVNDSTVNTDVSDTLTNHSEPAARSHYHSHDPSSDDAQASPPAQPVSGSSPKAKDSHEENHHEQIQEQSSDEVQPFSVGSIEVPLQHPTKATAEVAESSANSTNDPIDIQALVDTITANAAKEDDSQVTVPMTTTAAPGTSSSSLPPRPPPPQQSAQSYVPSEDARIYQPAFAPNSATLPPGLLLAHGATYPAGAPGTIDSHGALPPPPSASMNAPPMPPFPPSYPIATGVQPSAFTPSQSWESFLQDERRYVSEARWDRFPLGSRLFIGNLSSERVSKKEVFDIFTHYGNLAQISLKQAYGFVQYHTVDEGKAALDALQGAEIKGRKVHLETSRPQKKDGDGDKQRGNKRDRRDGDRHDGGRGRRDDYRPSRQPSPKRSGHRHQHSYGSERSSYDGHNSRRGRSRSPPHYGRRESGSGGYRQRSPSPYGLYPSEVELDIPRRYGASVPDVQFLLLHEVSRDFISWVEGAFAAAGLRVEVMFLNPRFPRHAVIQRQVVEGVHAVTELTFHAQQTSKIPLQVFDRSAGRDNVRFDQYQDLDPIIAAQLVVRAKGAFQPTHAPAPPYGGQQPTYNNHPAAYGNYPAYPPAYSQPSQQPPHMPPPYANQPYPPANAPVGSVDNHTLQQILGNIHNQRSPPAHGMPLPHPGTPADMNTFMAAGYGSNRQPLPHGAPPPAGSGDSAQHIQDIMAQLSRYRH